MSALAAISVNRGSITITNAPRFCAVLICQLRALNVLLGLCPQMRMHLLFLKSGQPAAKSSPGLPKVRADPLSRCQLHMWVVVIWLGVP